MPGVQSKLPDYPRQNGYVGREKAEGSGQGVGQSYVEEGRFGKYLLVGSCQSLMLGRGVG